MCACGRCPPQGSQQLKADGNKLHSAGRYADAADKYARAKSNLDGLDTPAAKDLRKACVLNLASCYLNLGRNDECVAECNAVLAGEQQPAVHDTFMMHVITSCHAFLPVHHVLSMSIVHYACHSRKSCFTASC